MPPDNTPTETPMPEQDESSRYRLLVVLMLMLIFVLGIFVVYWFSISHDNATPDFNPVATSTALADERVTGSPACLKDGETAEFEIEDNNYDSDSYVHAAVKNGINEVVNRFSATILQPGHYHPAELHSCGVYVVQGDDLDPRKLGAVGPNFFADLVKFDYEGKKTIILRMAEMLDEYTEYYSRDFRVSPNEQYLVLETLQMEPGVYIETLVIKDLQTMKDLFTLSDDQIAAEDPDMVGGIMMDTWTNDSRYFWFRSFETAYTNGWVRVDSTDWSYEIFDVPEGILGGYSLNYNTGWVPLVPGAFWVGVEEVNEEIRRERAALGETASLYLYNVITGEQKLIDTSDAPTWEGLNGEWVDSNTFEYDHPNGERKRYLIGDIQ